MSNVATGLTHVHEPAEIVLPATQGAQLPRPTDPAGENGLALGQAEQTDEPAIA